MSRTEGRFGDATAMRPTARARSFRLRKNCFGQLRSRNTSTCGTRRFVDRSRAYRMVRSARDASGCHIDGRNAGRPEDRGKRLTTTTWKVRSLQCRRGAFRGTIEKRQRPASIQMGSLTVGRTCPRVISECKNRIDQMISRTSSRSAGYLFQSRVVHRLRCCEQIRSVYDRPVSSFYHLSGWKRRARRAAVLRQPTGALRSGWIGVIVG
jgi:hypothetical protein